MSIPTIDTLTAKIDNLGLRAYDSLRTILQKEGEYYLSHQDLGFALMVFFPASAVLMQWPNEQLPEPAPAWSVKEDPEVVPRLVAGFFTQYPKAVVTLSSGSPVVLCCPDHPEWKRIYCFEALQEGVAAGFRTFGCAVPKPPA